MEPASDLYLDVALVYMRLVRNDSPEAASLIEKINASFGSRAGLRAALIIKIFKMEVTQNHWVPGIQVYNYLLEDYPEALPWLQRAMACCVRAWALQDLERIAVQPGGQAIGSTGAAGAVSPHSGESTRGKPSVELTAPPPARLERRLPVAVRVPPRLRIQPALAGR